jgi:hypothetical protein
VEPKSHAAFAKDSDENALDAGAASSTLQRLIDLAAPVLLALRSHVEDLS